MSESILLVRRLNAAYGRAQVLFDLDLELRAGEVAVLAGRNGAGKSTTLKAIMGLLPPASGVRSRGSSPSRSPASAWAMCLRSGASSPT